MTIIYPQFLILFLPLFLLYNRTKKTLLYISLSLVILSLTRPVLTEQIAKNRIDARDIIIALDVSYSMRADDIKPNRLERAKAIIEDILVNNKKDRFSLFVFTTNTLILSPATTDHRLLVAALKSLNVDNILTHGTNFENLFDRLKELKIPNKNLLLFSDGGDSLDVDIPKDIKIFAVGMATKRGSTLKDQYKKDIKDNNGNLVITRLNPRLKELAERSGGSFLYFDEIEPSLDFLHKSRYIDKESVSYIELFYIPLLLAIVLFFFSFIKIPKRVLFLLPFLSINAKAGIFDWYYIDSANKSYKNGQYKKAVAYFNKIDHKTIQSQLNLANSYYQLGDYKHAKTIYKSLKTTNPKFKKIALYKLGNCYAMLKEYALAKEYYNRALKFGADKDILYNLSLVSKKEKSSKKDFLSFKNQDKKEGSNSKSSNHKKSGTKSRKKTSQDGASSKGGNVSDKKSSSSKTVSSSKLTRPMGFKAYELINRGYIDEKKPW